MKLENRNLYKTINIDISICLIKLKYFKYLYFSYTNQTNMISLQNMLCSQYADLIEQGKVNFAFIEDKIPDLVREQLLDVLIEKDKKKFRKDIYDDLRTELLLATSKDIDYEVDMRSVWNGEFYERDMVKTLHIQFKEPRYMYAIVEDPEMIDDDDYLMISDNEKMLKHFAKNYSDHAQVIYTEISEFGPIDELQHPEWERINHFSSKFMDEMIV